MRSAASQEEYRMLRAEILQYLHNYQDVRNMMYASTLVCLGYALGSNTRTPCLYLLPLIVVVPSFLIAVNFWQSVEVDAAYLRVFHEGPDRDFQWETRHQRLFRQNPWLRERVNVQHLPYLLCGLSSLGLFWVSAVRYPHPGTLALGAAVTLACAGVYRCKHRLNADQIEEGWRAIQTQEEGDC